MNIVFCGLKHSHIFSLYQLAKQNSETVVLGAWESEETYRRAAQKMLTERFYTSYDAVLDDERVDTVAIGDAYGLRGQEVIRALKAGKHVLCDKPVCTDIAELDEIWRLSRKTGRKVICMLDLRYDPALRLMQELVRGGELGSIHAINFSGQHPLNYGTRPEWYFRPGMHGGTFNDLAIHGIDAVSYITGLSRLTVKCANAYQAFAPKDIDFKDCAQFMGSYENGAGIIADVSYSAPGVSAFTLPSYWRFSFWGDKGMAECRLGEGRVLLGISGRPAEYIEAQAIKDNCLTDLMARINGKTTAFEDSLLFTSTRNCLMLQQAADMTMTKEADV